MPPATNARHRMDGSARLAIPTLRRSPPQPTWQTIRAATAAAESTRSRKREPSSSPNTKLAQQAVTMPGWRSIAREAKSVRTAADGRSTKPEKRRTSAAELLKARFAGDDARGRRRRIATERARLRQPPGAREPSRGRRERARRGARAHALRSFCSQTSWSRRHRQALTKARTLEPRAHARPQQLRRQRKSNSATRPGPTAPRETTSGHSQWCSRQPKNWARRTPRRSPSSSKVRGP